MPSESERLLNILPDINNVLNQTGILLLGILAGELLHRLGLLYEESYHLKTRYRKRQGLLGAISAVFSNTNYQWIKFPILSTIGISFLLLSGGMDRSAMIKIFPVVAVWSLLRMIGAFDNSLEDMDILDANNALLGPGLGANYWFGFLKHMVTGNIREKLVEKLHLMEDDGEEVNIFADGKICPPPTSFKTNNIIFDRLIILLPNNCHLEIKDEQKLEAENIFKHTEMCKEKPECCGQDHRVEFKVEAAHRRDPIKQTVHWIYEREEDEKNHPEKIKDSKKIFMMFDFPQLLQTAMGPERGWEETEKPGARKRNLTSFKETLRKMLNCVDYSQMKKSVTFHMFKVDKDKKLSSQLREKVESDWQNENIQYSSASASDSEA